ncbi:MAG: putative oxidoreductase YtbE [Firmicutes bacterium ADurb.Bin356]|nr:MAG: putative oxidoreductase YtbE [Firmicutes bacterium ADurb.Bin356]
MIFSQTKKLNNGVEIPMLGLGVFLMPEQGVTLEAVRYALRVGYRHLDTASIYENEGEVGEGIKQSGVLREEIFLTTKLWNDDMRKGRAEAAFEESLKRLGTDYVDLYLLHWPVAGKFIESWKVLESLYKQKRIRAIGVSNFHKHHMEALLKEAEIVPAVNQIERHPLLSQKELIEYCTHQGIAVEAYSPLGSTGAPILSEETVVELARKYDRTPAQIVLKWNIEQGVIVIPKSTHKERILSNGQLDFMLRGEDIKMLDALNENKRIMADPENFNF